MYNYFKDLKIRQKLLEAKKEEEKQKKLKEIHDKDLMKYTSNYENRIINFIYQMAEKPIKLRDNPKSFLTTREKLLIEESDKILFPKRFNLKKKYKNKETINSYENKKDKNNINSITNKSDSINEKNKRIILNNNYIKSLSFEKKKKIENYENDYNYYYNIIQPHMKYTPRSDLERIYNDLGHIPNNLNVNSKKIVDTQLNKMGFKPKVETNKNFPEDIIDLNKDYYEDLIKENKNKIRKRRERKKFDLYNLKKNNKVDNSKAKDLYPELYHKTYFNAVENYSLFKNTCFLPNQSYFKSNSNSFNNNSLNKNTSKIKLKLKNPRSEKTEIEDYNYNSYDNFNLTNNNEKNNNKNKNFDFSDVIKLYNDINKEKEKEIEDKEEINSFDSLNNIDIFIKGINKNKTISSNNEKKKLNMLKKLAFEKKKKKIFSPLINENKKEDLKENEEEDEEDILIKKTEEKYKIDGIEYRKSDLENLSKAIMNKCKFTRKKYRMSDSDFSKSGNGKLMFTNGLTLSQFKKKFHFN